MPKVVLRPHAVEDLAGLYQYIAQDSPDRLASYIERLKSHCEGLAEFPERGVARDDISAGLRLLVFERSATIAYRIRANEIQIVRVFYRGRDFQSLLRDHRE